MTGCGGIGARDKDGQYGLQQTQYIKRRFVIITVDPCGFVVMYKVSVFHKWICLLRVNDQVHFKSM